MANFINKANENEFPTNGNCKRVRNITNNIDYGSVTEAAKKNDVSISVMSTAINKGYLCKGSRFMFVEELHKNTDKLCEENAKANARAAKAEARLSNMADVLAKAKAYDKLMAEQEAKRKAEEKRLEMERKAKEKHEKAIAKANDKVDRYEAEYARRKAKLKLVEDKLMAAQIELEALLDKEV